MQTEHEKNMTRLWCENMLKTDVKQIERNEGFYFYLYIFGDRAKEASKDAFMSALNK
jgi:hypothetical protein